MNQKKQTVCHIFGQKKTSATKSSIYQYIIMTWEWSTWHFSAYTGPLVGGCRLCGVALGAIWRGQCRRRRRRRCEITESQGCSVAGWRLSAACMPCLSILSYRVVWILLVYRYIYTLKKVQSYNYILVVYYKKYRNTYTKI